MEELLYFALIMLKRISPPDSIDPPISTPSAVVGPTTPPVATPSVAPAQPEKRIVHDVAIESPKVELKHPIATSSKTKASSKKKSKKK